LKFSLLFLDEEWSLKYYLQLFQDEPLLLQHRNPLLANEGGGRRGNHRLTEENTSKAKGDGVVNCSG